MIEPTPSLFYSIVTETFKERATFASRLIRDIKVLEDSKYVQTLCIGRDGIILVSKPFWKKMVRTKLDAKIVFLHEMFHALLGDTSKLESLNKQDASLANLSMDMRINAAIVACFLEKGNANQYAAGKGSDILSRMYKASGISGLLRPGSAYGKESKYRLIYSLLYRQDNNRATEKEIELGKIVFKSEESIRHALKVLIPKDKREETLSGIMYLGTHDVSNRDAEYKGRKDADADDKDPFVVEEDYSEIITGPADDVKEEIREALKSKLGEHADYCKQAGISHSLFDNILTVINSSKTLNLKCLDKFTCNKKVNVLKSFWVKQHRVSSVIPVRPTSRDMGILACGINPILWHNIKDKQAIKKKNIAIYLDVSGSVTDYLGRLLGIIKNLHVGINVIYCFSNEVHEQSVGELTGGLVKTTGGTDFDCIAEHAIKTNVDKAIIFTDGYADLNRFRGREDEVKAQLEDVAMVYFGTQVNKNNWFAKNYLKAFDLQELINEVV